MIVPLIVGLAVALAATLAVRELRWQHRHRHGLDDAFRRDDALERMRRWYEEPPS